MTVVNASREPRPGQVSVKICGLTRTEDGRLAGRSGAAYVGTILSPGFARSVEPEEARAIGREAGVPLVAVLVDPTVDEAVRIARRSGASVLQLHGNEPPEMLEALRSEGEWAIWKSVAVREPEALMGKVEPYRGRIDALLLEGWHAGTGGGVGALFDWTAVAGVRDRLDGFRLVAAGGLAPDNVADAIHRLRPDVVDVSSGVESALRIKDPDAVRAFIRNALAATVS